MINISPTADDNIAYCVILSGAYCKILQNYHLLSVVNLSLAIYTCSYEIRAYN